MMPQGKDTRDCLNDNSEGINKVANKVVSAVYVLLVSLAGISGTYAADGTIHATGDVTNSTCEVDVAGTSAQYGTIDFGSVKKSMVYGNLKLQTAQPIGTAFILFKNCKSTDQYTMTLSGVPGTSSGASTKWANTASGGTNATLAGRIELPDGTFKFIENGVRSDIYTVGADSRSLKFCPYLYLEMLSALTYGPAQYNVDYTVDFQ
ncbi:fimbrial protein [Enterobacter kobei]|uniref:fimbrial protein n=1 Tax=Enterobacter kobei TaxID=208224 RepID=UPI003CE750DA